MIQEYKYGIKMIIHILITDELSDTMAFNSWTLEVEAKVSVIQGQPWSQARVLK